MHFDLETDDIEAEVQRLEALGAARYDHQQERGFDFWVMRDPWATSSACSTRTSPTCSPGAGHGPARRVCNVTPATARLLRWSPDPGWAADP
jgi:hypothetical protein